MFAGPTAAGHHGSPAGLLTSEHHLQVPAATHSGPAGEDQQVSVISHLPFPVFLLFVFLLHCHTSILWRHTGFLLQWIQLCGAPGLGPGGPPDLYLLCSGWLAAFELQQEPADAGGADEPMLRHPWFCVWYVTSTDDCTQKTFAGCSSLLILSARLSVAGLLDRGVMWSTRAKELVETQAQAQKAFMENISSEAETLQQVKMSPGLVRFL